MQIDRGRVWKETTYHFSSPHFWLSINIVPQLHDTQRDLDGELSAEQKLCWQFLSNWGGYIPENVPW